MCSKYDRLKILKLLLNSSSNIILPKEIMCEVSERASPGAVDILLGCTKIHLTDDIKEILHKPRIYTPEQPETADYYVSMLESALLKLK